LINHAPHAQTQRNACCRRGLDLGACGRGYEWEQGGHTVRAQKKHRVRSPVRARIQGLGWAHCVERQGNNAKRCLWRAASSARARADKLCCLFILGTGFILIIPSILGPRSRRHTHCWTGSHLRTYTNQNLNLNLNTNQMEPTRSSQSAFS
jgi:hypothetical protein